MNAVNSVCSLTSSLPVRTDHEETEQFTGFHVPKTHMSAHSSQIGCYDQKTALLHASCNNKLPTLIAECGPRHLHVMPSIDENNIQTAIQKIWP